MAFVFFFSSVCQGLFYRVIGGEISPFRLVRLSPEELLSKEMSDWRKTENTEVKQTNKQEKHFKLSALTT